MSRAIRPSPTEPAGLPAALDLPTLRAEIDRLDDALHATLMRRAEVVAALARLHAKRATPLRPGREAAIIRRLLASHHGPLPRQAIVRLWRELLAGTTALQACFALAVCAADPNSAMAAIAREHFGALTPLHCHHTPADALRAVREGAAAVAVLPMPAQDASDPAWWTALRGQDEPALFIAGRLPFWAPRPEGAPDAQAFVVSAAEPDPSGQDRSLLCLELAPGTGRAQLRVVLTAAGFAPHELTFSPSATGALAEVEGFVPPEDPRLAKISGVLGPPAVLGAYAVPIEETRA